MLVRRSCIAPTRGEGLAILPNVSIVLEQLRKRQLRGLVVSDIDGTLLPEETTLIPEVIFGQIQRLAQCGYGFVAASGRQYSNLRKIFAPVQDEILYICENGTAVFYQDTLIEVTPIPMDLAHSIARAIYDFPEIEVVASDPHLAHIVPKANTIDAIMTAYTGPTLRRHSHPEALPEGIVKVSAYTPPYTATTLAPHFERPWAERLHMAIAGESWLDFTLATKGLALERLVNDLGLCASDIYVFGDNYNDISMLQYSPHSYVVRSAVPEVQAMARAGVIDSVPQKIETLLYRLEQS